MTTELLLTDSEPTSTMDLGSQFEPKPISAAAAEGPSTPAPPTLELSDAPSELHQNYWDVIKENPDKAAQVLKLSKTFAAEPATVAKDLEGAKLAAQAPTEEYWRNYEKNFPLTAQFLKERQNMAVAKDDFDKLGFFESMIKQISSGAMKGNLEARQAELWADRLAETRETGQVSSKHEAELQQLEKDVAPYSQIDASAGKNFHPLYQFSAQIPNMSRALVRFGAGERGSEILGPAVGTAAAGAATGAAAGAVGFGAGAIPGAITGAGYGMIPGMAMYAYQLEGGNAFKDYVGLKDKAGNPINPKAAADAAHTVGLINAGLETAGDLILAKVMAPAAKAAGSVIAEPAMKVILKVPGGQKLAGVITAQPKVFEGMTLGQAIREAGKLLIEGEVGEISTEYAQEISTGLGQESAMKDSGQEFEQHKDFGQIASDATGVIYPTFQSMLVPGLFGGGSHIRNSIKEMQKAQLNKQVYEELGKTAAQSKTRERLPEAHKEFVDQVTKGTPVEKVYIPADAFEMYFQSKKIDPTTAAQELGIEKQLKQAKESNGDLEIPLSTWTAHVAGTEHYQGLSEDIKFAPEDVTPRQAKELQGQVEQQIQEVVQNAQAVIEKDSAKKAGADFVYNDIKQEMLGAKPKEIGPKEEKAWLRQAESNASLWAARAVVEASRRGISVEEYWKTPGVKPEIVTEARPYRKSVVQVIRDAIDAGQAEKGGVTKDAEGYVTGRYGAYSTFPEWFKDKGYSKDATLSLLDKYLAGQELTQKQSETLQDLYYSSGLSGQQKQMDVANEPFLQSAQPEQLPDLNLPADHFENPQADKVLPALNAQDLALIGAEPKDLILKASVVERNKERHQEIAGNDAQILQEALYSPTELIQGHPSKNPNYWAFVKQNGDSKLAVVELSKTKDGYEVVDWRYTNAEDVARIKERAEREGGQVLITERANPQGAAGLSDLTPGTSSIAQIGPDMSLAARNARAAAMGFDTSKVYYHGTSRDFTGFSPKTVGKAGRNHGKVYWASSSANVAESFAALSAHADAFKKPRTKAVWREIDALDKQDADLHAQWKSAKTNEERIAFEDRMQEIDDKKYSLMYPGQNIIPMYAKLENPLLFDGGGRFLNEGEINRILDKARAEGHDGVVFQHIVDTPRGDTEELSDVVAVFKPSQFRSVNAAFDPAKAGSANLLFQNEDAPRGSVQFGKDAAVITLFKSADASTFLHESAHVWLKDMFDYVRANESKLSEQYARDWLTLSEWLKISPDQKTLTVEQHEQFARGFEAYVREGNAPSEGLRKAFRMFRLWLTRIYRDIAGLNVQISDPVRGVMDRMLATEDEIAQAQKEVAYTPASVNLEGVSKEVASQIEKLQTEAHEEAVAELMKTQMDELKAERQAFLDARKAEISKEVTKETSQLHIYTLMRDIKEQLKSKKNAKVIAGEFLAGKLKGEALARFEALADINTYSSADEMARAIAAAEPFTQKVNKEVQARMAEYADLKDTSLLKDAALKAIHNEKMLELMALEADMLQGLVNKAEVTAEVRKRKANEARIEAAAAKEKARAMLLNSNLRGATTFMPYFTQEKRWAMSVAKAIAEKDYERAASAKRMQLLNHALAMESLRLKRQTDKWISFLEDTQTKKKDLFKKDEHFTQAADLLGRLGFQRKDYDPKYKRETFAQWATRLNEITNTVSVPDWLLNSSESINFQELSVSQLEDAVNALKNILSVANFENRALVISKGATLDEIIGNLATSAKLNVKEQDRYKPTMEPDRFDDAKRFASKYLLSITKIQTLLRKVDGYKDFGKWFSTFWEPVYKAANEESKLMSWANDGLAKLWEPYSAKERKEMLEKRIYYPEIGTSATKMRLIMMAMNLGNLQNKEKLFQTPPVGIEGTVNWDGQVVMNLLQKHLTEKDWQFVQNTWDFLNELWPQISKMHKELTGFTPAKVEATPFNVTTSDGQLLALRGGYFPLKEDPRASLRASLREQLDSPLYTEQNPGWVAATRTGHTKARTEAQYSVSLDVTLIYRHLRDVIHDLAFRPTIIDLRRLMNDERMHDVIKESIGPEGYASLREWVANAAGGNTVERTGSEVWERAVGWLRRHATVAALMMKPSVIIQNLANPFLFSGAMEGFGPKQALNAFFVRGMLNYLPKTMFDWKAQEEIKDFVYSRSAFMRDKATNPDFSLAETHNKLFGKDSKIQEFATGLMGGSDELTAMPMWLEAYHSKMESGLVEEVDAIKYADTLIDRVLGSGRKYDAAAIQRGGELAKSLSMFYTFLNTEYNRWASEVGATRLDPSRTPRMLGFMASRLLFFQVASSIFSGKLPGDDEDALKFWLKQLLSYPLSLFPGIREMSSVAMDEMLGLKSFGYKPSPAVGAIDSMLFATKEGMKLLDGKGESERFFEATSKSAAYLFPYPDQFNTWFWNSYDYAVHGMEPKVMDLYRRRPKKER